MKKTKQEKGITLITLIITIVVLLILAVVTIGAVQESGIIGHAQDAASEYTIAQEKERIALAYSEYQIEKLVNSKDELSLLEVTDAKVSRLGNWGWQVTFSNTGNSYAIDTNGEYNEDIKNELTNAQKQFPNVEFFIYHDKVAKSTNIANGNKDLKEDYLFYNWSTVTSADEVQALDDAGFKLLMADMTGDGIVDELDNNMIDNRVITNNFSNYTDLPLEILKKYCEVLNSYTEEWCYECYNEDEVYLPFGDANYDGCTDIGDFTVIRTLNNKTFRETCIKDGSYENPYYNSWI